MTQQKKTHFRTFSNSKHLASDDLLGMDGIKVTIDQVRVGRDLNKRKTGDLPICRFKERMIRPGEQLKTMILNATNMRVLEDITGSPYLEDWDGVEIEIYVDNKVRFGNELVDGLRFRKPAINPELAQKEVLDSERIPKMIEYVIGGGMTLEQVYQRYAITNEQTNEINKLIKEAQNA